MRSEPSEIVDLLDKKGGYSTSKPQRFGLAYKHIFLSNNACRLMFSTSEKPFCCGSNGSKWPWPGIDVWPQGNPTNWGDHLQQSSGMDNFVNRVQNMYVGEPRADVSWTTLVRWWFYWVTASWLAAPGDSPLTKQQGEFDGLSRRY